MKGGSNYDAVVIGAGHNGLVLATYLQRNGMRTLLLEQSDSIGGRTSTLELFGGGYHHNPHANFLSYQKISPFMSDFQLYNRGFTTVTPTVQSGIAFSDGRPPVLIHRLDCNAATFKSFSNKSRADADVFRQLQARVESLTASIKQLMYSPLSEQRVAAHTEVVANLYADLGLLKPLGSQTAAELIDNLFEHQDIRTLLYALTFELGGSLSQPASDISFLGFVLWLVGQRELPLGGMQALADSLLDVAIDAGVEIRTACPVSDIVVDQGRVMGVRVSGGYIRSGIVASSADLQQTLTALLPNTAIGREARVDIKSLEQRTATTIASQAFALRQPPNYRSSQWDGDINRCMQTYIGFNTPADVLEYERDLGLNLLAKPCASVRVPSMWDPQLSPRGLHLAGADSLFPDDRSLSDNDWVNIENSYNQALLETWREVAPNMTADNVLHCHFARPTGGDRTVLLRDGECQYKSDVQGLYFCGSATYPGGGVHGACATNAFAAIAADVSRRA